MEQLELFTGLPIPPVRPRRRGPSRRRSGEVFHAEQLAFAFRLRRLECDRDTAFDFPHHAVISAAATPAPETTAPRSIFDLAAAAGRMLKRGGRFGDAAGFEVHAPAPTKSTIERTTEGTRHIGVSYPARWTEEDYERERQRRARQRPPRPSKKVRTRSAKLLGIISDPGDDDSDI